MTEVCLRVPPVPFNREAQQQAEAGTTTAHQPGAVAVVAARVVPRGVQPNETFVPLGANLDLVFAK